jgi:hypothetical protein
MTPSRPPSNVIECRDPHLYYLCERMRPDEIEQYLALTGAAAFVPEVAARGFAAIGGLRFTVLGPDGFPAAAGGYSEVEPGVWQSWMVGSIEGWRTSWRAMTKATLWLMDSLLDMGARRLETSALASRVAATQWYEFLGMQYEGTWRRRAANGADVACYARVRED